mmetsp:Transcript_35961/g.90587  ORF Transcript_35961/g.90587 Transcript_35961/m.90587 type:complete len:102 (+) Transcript_35961:487-792(+)
MCGRHEDVSEVKPSRAKDIQTGPIDSPQLTGGAAASWPSTGVLQPEAGKVPRTLEDLQHSFESTASLAAIHHRLLPLLRLLASFTLGSIRFLGVLGVILLR